MKLIIKNLEKTEIGPDTRVDMVLAETDGPAEVPLSLTFHNVKAANIDIDRPQTGMRVITKEGAPIHINLGKPVASGIF